MTVIGTHNNKIKWDAENAPLIKDVMRLARTVRAYDRDERKADLLHRCDPRDLR